jgi:high-affinity K+ transport system ATPase subunit B
MSPKVLEDSIIRLNPVSLLSNPVMLIVELTFFVVTAMAIVPQAFYPVASSSERVFYVEVAIIPILWRKLRQE